ncbi:MAG: SHOCT domain-containing protein [Actinomycetes bacterium]|jgi:putative membrane protein
MRMLLTVAFVIAVIAVVGFGVAWFTTAMHERRRAREEDPKEILKRRYAAGEIDEDEYLRRMSGLSQDW